MTRFYRPTPSVPTLRDALREWRMGLPMLLPFALVGLAMRIL